MGNTSQLTTDGFDVCTHDGLVSVPMELLEKLTPALTFGRFACTVVGPAKDRSSHRWSAGPLAPPALSPAAAMSTDILCRTHSHTLLYQVHIPQPQKAGSDAVIVSPFSVDEAEVERQLRLEAVERSAERKVLWRLLPCLFLFSLLNYIDR